MRHAYLRLAPELLGDAEVFAALKGAGVKVVASGRSNPFSDDLRLWIASDLLPEQCDRELIDVDATFVREESAEGTHCGLAGFVARGVAQESPDVRVAALHLGPSDILVVGFNGGPLTREATARLKEQVRSVAGDRKVLVHDGRLELAVLRSESA